MKNTIILILAAAMVLSLAACSLSSAQEPYYEEPVITTSQTAEPETEDSQVVNPVVEYSSLEEANAVLGTSLSLLGGSEEAFAVINEETAQYTFTKNGVPFTYRANPYTYEDISGLYLEDGLAFDNFHPGNDEPFHYLCNDQYKIGRWFTTSQTQYVLAAEDNGSLSEEDFLAMVLECQKVTGLMKSNEYYDNLAGSYYDDNGHNATMEVVSCGYEGVIITVLWNNSAATKDCWTMDAQIDDATGLLAYSDCLHQLITFAEDGSETRETLEENIAGYFSYDEETGHLLWTGAEEGCEEAVFILY